MGKIDLSFVLFCKYSLECADRYRVYDLETYFRDMKRQNKLKLKPDKAINFSILT